MRTIYGAVDTRRFHPAPRTEALARLDLPADRPVILFVGNLLSVKGVDVLIEACQYLNAMGRRFTCRLVGEGPLRPHLERQIARRGLQDTVRLEGVRPHQQLPDWYRAASLFVLPSRSEGVPTVLLEAAACGTPFVATRVGGIPEIAHLGVSRLVPPEDAAALTRAVAAALDDPCAQRSSAPAHVRGLRELADDLTDFFRERLRPEKHSVGQALDVAVAKR